MMYLAACALVFWFVFIPIMRELIFFGTAAYMIVDGIRNTEAIEEKRDKIIAQTDN